MDNVKSVLEENEIHLITQLEISEKREAAMDQYEMQHPEYKNLPLIEKMKINQQIEFEIMGIELL